MGSSLIGQLRIALGLETASLETGSKRAKQELLSLKDVGEQVKRTFELVGITLGAAAFVEYAKGALEYAASLKTTSERIGVTVEQLQVMRKAARDNGVEQDAMEKGLARLNLTLGKAKAGNEQAIKSFANIGITKAQLDSFHNAGDVLPAVEQGLHKVGDSATQSAAAQAILSRAALAALPVFTMGKEAYDAMYESAVKSGLITEDQAIKAHEATVAVEDMAIALKTRLAEALADNVSSVKSLIDEIVQLINLIPNLVSRLADAGDRIGKLGDATEDMSNFGTMLSGQISVSQWWERRKQLSADSDRRDRHMAIRDSMRRGIDPIPVGGPFGEEATQIMRDYGPVYHAPTKPPPDTLDLSTHHKPKHTRDKANEIARDNENKQFEIDKATLDEKQKLLQAQQALTIDTEDRNNLGLQLLDVEHDQQALEIQHKLAQTLLDKNATEATKDAARAQAAKALALNDQLLILRKQGENLQAELAREQQQAETDGLAASLKTDRLKLEEGLSQTAAKRRDIELQILDIETEQKRAALEHIVNDQYLGKYTHTEDDRTRAQMQLNALAGSYGLQRQQIMNNTAGPLEQLRLSIPDTAAKMNEALQTVASQGLQSVVDGLAQASASWIKMGGTAGNILRQIYSDIMKLLLMKYIEKPALDALGGLFHNITGGLSSIGGPDFGALGAGLGGGSEVALPPLPHFASGGSFMIGGMGGVDQNLLSINGVPRAMVSDSERLDVVPANGGGGGGGDAVRLIIEPSELFTTQLAQASDIAATRGAAGGAMLGRIQLVQAAGRRLGR